MTAGLEFADHPGRRYTATVASTARALDALSRTLQVELQIDNARGELLPGSYAQVYFDLPAALDTLRIPVNTVLFRTQNLQVATVGERRTVHLKSFTEGRDFGTELEVLGGLTAADAIIVNPPDSITEGAAGARRAAGCGSADGARPRERRPAARAALALLLALPRPAARCAPHYKRPACRRRPIPTRKRAWQPASARGRGAARALVEHVRGPGARRARGRS